MKEYCLRRLPGCILFVIPFEPVTLSLSKRSAEFNLSAGYSNLCALNLTATAASD